MLNAHHHVQNVTKMLRFNGFDNASVDSRKYWDLVLFTGEKASILKFQTGSTVIGMTLVSQKNFFQRGRMGKVASFYREESRSKDGQN